MPFYDVYFPYPSFLDINGEPLQNGYVYIGEPSLNPVNNPITIYWDKSTNYPVSQPIRTINGYPSRNGTPHNMFVDLDSNDGYSMSIYSKEYVLLFTSEFQYSDPGAGNVALKDENETITGAWTFEQEIIVNGFSSVTYAQLFANETVSGTWQFNNPITVNGVSSADYAVVSANETVTGTWTFDNELSINGVSSADYAVVSDNETITGDYDFTGALTKNSSLIYSAENGPLAGFRNKIINGNFDFWDYSTSQTSDGYGSDNQWDNAHSGSTKTHSQQAHTLGQTDVPGNSKYYSRTIVTTGGGVSDFVLKRQKIENVDTFSGQTVTLSFYARADSSKNIAMELIQSFGTGGTPSANVTSIGVTTHALTSSWTKYTATVTVPSVSGETLGTDGNDWLGAVFWFEAGSNYDTRTNSLGNQSGTFDIDRVQLEPGPVATEFEDRPETVERSLCNRFMFQLGDATRRATFSAGRIVSATTAGVGILFPDEMRAPPTLVVSSVGAIDVGDGGGSSTSTALSSTDVTTKTSDMAAVTAGLANIGGGTTFRIRTNQWIRFSAVL